MGGWGKEWPVISQHEKAKCNILYLLEVKKPFIPPRVRFITNCTIILFHGARKTELGVLSANSDVEEIMTCFLKKKKVLN